MDQISTSHTNPLRDLHNPLSERCNLAANEAARVWEQLVRVSQVLQANGNPIWGDVSQLAQRVADLEALLVHGRD